MTEEVVLSNVPEWPSTVTVMSYKPRKKLHRALITTRVPGCKHIVSQAVNHADASRAKYLAKTALHNEVTKHAGHPRKGE